MKTLIFGFVFAFFLSNPTANVTSADLESDTAAKWERLGKRKVKRGIDHDVISVTRAEGRFSAIKLKVLKSGINMHRCVVYFTSGDSQKVQLKNDIRAGGETRVINLEGRRKRVINRVEFWYDTKGLINDKAVVELWGRH